MRMAFCTSGVSRPRAREGIKTQTVKAGIVGEEPRHRWRRSLLPSTPIR